MRLMRCCLVLLVTTLAAAAALRLLVPSAVGRDPGFAGLLVGGCAAVAAGCVLWGWLSALAVVAEAMRRGAGTATHRVPCVPVALHRTVLAACGVALCATGSPALAAPGTDTPRGLPTLVAGLPLPARAMDLPARRTVVVRPGDSLWTITARRLPPDASDAEITAAWRELYRRNRTVVGDEPALIHPGQRLALPRTLEER